MHQVGSIYKTFSEMFTDYEYLHLKIRSFKQNRTASVDRGTLQTLCVDIFNVKYISMVVKKITSWRMTSISFSSCCVTLAYFRFVASPITFLQPFLFFAAAFKFRIWRKSTASVQRASSHLLLGCPTGHLLPKYRPMIFSKNSRPDVHTAWHKCSC